MPFDNVTINRVFELSEEYKAIFKEPNYDRILKELKNDETDWKRGSSNEVIFFPIIPPRLDSTLYR